MRSKFPLVLVKWHDAYAMTHWVDVRELPEDDPGIPVETVGWLVREGKNSVTLASTLSVDGGAGGREVIPKPWVRNIIHLKEAKCDRRLQKPKQGGTASSTALP